MKKTETDIHGLYTIEPFFAKDDRGFFTKDYLFSFFNTGSSDHKIKEIFYSFSKKGVIRGLHFQNAKQQQKQVRCLSGNIMDYVVDLRKNSPTFKQWRSFNLTGPEGIALLIPAGCAHGFIALEDSVVSYYCTNEFDKDQDSGIRWNDPDIGIEWPIEKTDEIIISEKDSKLQSFKDFMTNYDVFDQNNDFH